MVWIIITFGMGLVLLALFVLPFILIVEYLYKKISQPQQNHAKPILSVIAVSLMVGVCVFLGIYSYVTNL